MTSFQSRFFVQLSFGAVTGYLFDMRRIYEIHLWLWNQSFQIVKKPGFH